VTKEPTMEASSVAAGAEPPHTRPVARATTSPLGGLAAYGAELLGTLMLVFCIGMVVSINSGDGLGVTDFAVIGLVHTWVLMLLVHSLGGASGAHFNPAVTIALLVTRKIRGADAGIYIVMQLVGAVLGAFLVKALLLNEGDAVGYGALSIADAAPTPAAAPGAPPPPAGADWLGGSTLGGLAAEAIGTFFLMWAIMAMAVNPRGERHWAAFVIGATLGFAVMILAPLTGAGFNPARWLGPALASGTWDDGWVFIVAPVIGAVLAAFLYTALVLDPEGRRGERPIDVLD
jgi:MIP family channel proteins